MRSQSSSLTTIEINPDQSPTTTIIWLHGLGADGNDFTSLVPELNLWPTHAVRFIFPNAPLRAITINNGYVMPGWYDIKSLTRIEGSLDQVGIQESVRSIHEIIEKEEQRGIASRQIFLGGFSQGSLIALLAGLTYKNTLGGLLGLSGYFPFPNPPLTDANSKTPIFLGHGTDDNVVPFFLGQMANDLLVKLGLNVSFHRYTMGHTVCLDEIHAISHWLKQLLT